MKLLFLGDLEFGDIYLAYHRVGLEVFSRISKIIDTTKFFIYFQDGSVYTRWQKLFGIELVNENIIRLGIFPLIYFVLKFRPAVIQITSQAAYYLPIFFISKIFRIKTIFHLHNIYRHTLNMDLTLQGYKKYRALLIELVAVKMSSRILVLSEREKNLLIEHYYLKNDKIRIVSNGTNLYDIKKDYNYNFTSPIKIITVGSLDRLEKGIDFLLDILDLLCIKVELSICNSNKQMQNHMTKTSNIRIDFIPPLTEINLRNEFVKHDVFISLSRYDSFNMALLEAMNAGMLFIASEKIGLVERFDHELRKFVVPFGNKDIVINKLNEIVNLSIEDRVELSKRAREFSKCFSWDKTVTQYVDIYNDINNHIR